MPRSVFSIGHSAYLYILFAFIMKIFNLRGNYPVISNYTVREKSSSFSKEKLFRLTVLSYIHILGEQDCL